MPIALHHVTQYLYDRHVRLGPQIIRLRPAPHYRGRVISYAMKVEPASGVVRWMQDAFSNEIAEVSFPDACELFRISVDLVIDDLINHPFGTLLHPDACDVPPVYDSPLIKALAPYRHLEPAGALLQQYLGTIDRSTRRATDFLLAINQRVHSDIRYLVRREHGVQTPEQTLHKQSGSCRDSGWLLVQLLRHCGFAARFVSGYLMQPSPPAQPAEAPSVSHADQIELHAWCEAYVPDIGWIGLDPTSGLLAGAAHVPVACADRKSTRLNSSHVSESRMPSSA